MSIFNQDQLAEVRTAIAQRQDFVFLDALNGRRATVPTWRLSPLWAAYASPNDISRIALFQ